MGKNSDSQQKKEKRQKNALLTRWRQMRTSHIPHGKKADEAQGLASLVSVSTLGANEEQVLMKHDAYTHKTPDIVHGRLESAVPARDTVYINMQELNKPARSDDIYISLQELNRPARRDTVYWNSQLVEEIYKPLTVLEMRALTNGDINKHAEGQKKSKRYRNWLFSRTDDVSNPYIYRLHSTSHAEEKVQAVRKACEQLHRSAGCVVCYARGFLDWRSHKVAGCARGIATSLDPSWLIWRAGYLCVPLELCAACCIPQVS